MVQSTSQSPDFYAVGNDYAQAPLSSFFDTTTDSATSGEYVHYQDGIFTQLADTLVSGEYSANPWKDPAGFNKRKVLVNPSASYTDEDYAVVDVIDSIETSAEG